MALQKPKPDSCVYLTNDPHYVFHGLKWGAPYGWQLAPGHTPRLIHHRGEQRTIAALQSLSTLFGTMREVVMYANLMGLTTRRGGRIDAGFVRRVIKRGAASAKATRR